MYKGIRTFLKNSNFIAAVIIIAGLIMDIGVNISNVFLIAVTESYMDYIYSAIITIAILSFTIITLISGMLDSNYYGYKLKEIIQFKDSPVNFKEYICWSFGSIFLATCFLAADFNINCVNGLTMLLFAVIYLEWNMAINIYKIMVDENLCYNLVINYYETICDKERDSNFYRNELNRIFLVLKQCIKDNDYEQKKCIFGLLVKLESVVFDGDRNDINSIYQYFYNHLKELVYDIANNFGYNEMIKDVIKVYKYLPQFEYNRVDLYIIPLDKMRFWNDQLLLENDYFSQIRDIDFLDEYSNGLIKESEVERIFFCFFKNIMENQICTSSVKMQIIESYLRSLTKFYWKSRKDSGLPLDCIGALNIWHYYILKNENIEERNFIFKILVREIFYNNFYSKEKKYFDVLSLMFQSFYAYAFCEGETLNPEYRESLQATCYQTITNAALKNFKLSILFRNNIEEILVAIGRRIAEKSEFESRFDNRPPFMIAKTVIWTQEFNIRFLFILYIIYYGEIGFYSIYNRFLTWENIENETKLNILNSITKEFDLETGILKERFEDECRQLGSIVECTYKISEDEQKRLYEHLREEQEKLLLSKIEDTNEPEVEHKEIYQNISELMKKEQVFGWDSSFSSDFYIKYVTPICTCRKEYRTTLSVARSLQLAIIDSVENYIQKNTNKLELSFDLEGINRLIEFLQKNQYDSKNFIYTNDWALARYRKDPKFIELVEKEQGIETVHTTKIGKEMFFNKDNFRFNAKISKVEFAELTLDECAEYIEGSRSYNGFYNVDGVLMPKDKAIQSIQKIFCKESYAFKLMISFGRKDITHISYK